jgi:hypothetical protein
MYLPMTPAAFVLSEAAKTSCSPAERHQSRLDLLIFRQVCLNRVDPRSEGLYTLSGICGATLFGGYQSINPF